MLRGVSRAVGRGWGEKGRVAGASGLDVDASAATAFALNHLAAAYGSHSGAKTLLAGTFSQQTSTADSFQTVDTTVETRAELDSQSSTSVRLSQDVKSGDSGESGLSIGNLDGFLGSLPS